ncbi:MAG: TIGR01212 family radical SAM protein [Clostridia bacterium]|nr:TIGR01212 family radical SAM protein [Clostridia bacterium]
MENRFKYTLDNKRYHTWNYHLKKTFGKKVFKVALNGGFTCPNLDGTKGIGGCTYCLSGSGDFAGNPNDDILTQFEKIKAKMHQKWSDALYIPYFQANTNTYAPIDVLKEKFEPVLSQAGVVGLAIATRADCLTDEILDYLEDLNNRTYLIVELGLQTVFDKTGDRINRCHTFSEFLEGYNNLKKRNIKVCVHLIEGLPGETREMMIESARKVALLRPDFVKIHLLHILKGTKIAKQYENGEFDTLSLKEYVEIICDCLELFHEETVIQRLTGDGGRDDLIAPLWSLKKFVVLNEIDKEMLRRGSYQGIKYPKA